MLQIRFISLILLAVGFYSNESCGGWFSKSEKSSASFLNLCSQILAQSANTFVAKRDETVVVEKGRLSKVHFVSSRNPKAAGRPVFVLIPGGPGLSSRTLVPLGRLSEHFDLAFVDPPGTGVAAAVDLDIFPPEGNLYEWMADDIAKKVLEEIILRRGRSAVVVGHSYGGVIGGDVVIRIQRQMPGTVKGFVPIAAALTFRSHRRMEEIRDSVRGQDPDYLKHRDIVLNWDVGAWESHFQAVAEREIRRNHLRPKSLNPHHAAFQFRRVEYALWALAYGDLICNEADEVLVRHLLTLEMQSCSPETVRRVQKRWGQDQKHGNQLVTALRSMPELRRLMVIGRADRLVPANELLQDAEELHADVLIVDGGSHFPFATDINYVLSGLADAFLEH